MDIRSEVFHMVSQAKRAPGPVLAESRLQADLGFDSLSFISLLLLIEERYAIRFELAEMEGCAQAGRLAALVDEKIRELNAHDEEPACQPQQLE